MKRSPLVKSGMTRSRCRSAVVHIFALALCLCIVFKTAGASAEDAASGLRAPGDLSLLTIEELADIEITSVSKRPEPLSNAAAAVYVITRDDIRRSGATSIPEILRLAPNLQVARVDSSQYAISARGFNSTTANKLLVLIDGRSVYTPLYSGVFWDVQDVLLDDIERIEVISGPGGTLWGANAVNGVINIITLHSQNTQGGLLNIGGGTEERGVGARYGGQFGDRLTYRIYAKGFDRQDTDAEIGTSAQDAWRNRQGGLRIDWGSADNAFTLQGDVYNGSIDQAFNDDKTIAGGNLLARWSRTLRDGSAIQVQAYYDRTRRFYPGTFGEVLSTYDIDAQHRFQWGTIQDIVWGGGFRLSRDDVRNTAGLAFLPSVKDLSIANLFIQDSVALNEYLQLTFGTKIEHNNYTGFEVEPSIRLAWKLRDDALLWSAISRAVRTPSRLDRDFFVPGSAPFVFAGGPDFKSEKLIAYEIGIRGQPMSRASLSISTFYNDYDDLRSIELAPGGVVPVGPFVLGNKMEGNTYGVEMWGDYRVMDGWRLTAGYNYLKKHLGFKSDSTDITGVQAAGNDPSHQISVRSRTNLPYHLELDAAMRIIGHLPNPNVPDYLALDGRLGWAVWKGVELSVTGSNLLDQSHPEFGAAPARSQIRRMVFVRMLWTF